MQYDTLSDTGVGLYAEKRPQHCKASWKSRSVLHMYDPTFPTSRKEYRLTSQAIEQYFGEHLSRLQGPRFIVLKKLHLSNKKITRRNEFPTELNVSNEI